MVKTPKSPGDYGTEIYSYINELDPTFKDDVTTDQFLEKIQDEAYANKIYAYLADSDETFVEDISLEDFLGGVKKKEETAVTESVSGAGLSEQRLASRDLEAERMSAFGAAGGGRVVDSREVPQEGYNSPAEIAKRDSATTAIDTREANIAAYQLGQRQEEAKRITAGLPPVTIPEGSVTDALQQLRKVYGPYGLQFSEEKVPAAMTRSGSKVVKATVPNGVGGKPIEVRLELDEDGNIKPSEAEKIDALLRENATYVGETDTSFVEKALKVDQMRPVPRIDSSGVSTVKMASAEVDGKFIAYPTLFPKDPAGTTSTNPNDWMELDFGFAAQDEAFKRGEVFEFDTDEEAKAFAAGAWKGVVPMDLEFQKRHREMGRDYDADMAFLDELTERRDEYRFIEDLPVPGARYEKGLIPASYQKYFIDGNMVRDDIETMRAEKEAELSMLESQFDEDNVLLRLKEDRDVALGERFEQLSTEAAEINADAKTRQNQLQVESIKTFGVRLEDLVTYEPKTEEELRAMIGLYDDYNRAASQRQAAALGYERAQTYYDKQYDKGITQEYVDGWEEVSVAWDNGWKRGEAMSKLLLMQMGYYNVIGDEGAEEQAMREVSEIMDSQDPRRGRLVSRANMTGTTDSYLASISSNPGMYTAAITAESLGQLLPIWYRVALPTAIAGGVAGGVYGAAAGPGGALAGFAGGAFSGFLKAGFYVGMPISELALEMGNATLEVGERMGYDWSDPNSALKALNDEKLWADATQRGLERGIPIASMGVLSNFFIGAVAGRSASLSSTGERVLRGAGTGLIAEPATEALGEYMAIQATGEYTGSTANFREIMAEAIGAVGMGATMGTAFGALGYAKQKLKESNFDLAIKLMDPMGLGAENVSNERIMNWANRMEKLGQITPEQAEYIRKNTGYRRQANELLGRGVDARPGTKAKVVGRLMQLLEAKDYLSKPGTSFAFGRKLSEINEEISYIAENQSNRSEQVDLSLIDTRTRQAQPGAYRFNGKNVSRQDFLNKLQEATPSQLRKALVYNDQAAAAELKAKRDAISKRETTEVPVGKRTGFGSEVDGEVRDITQEVINEQAEGKLDEDEIENLLAPIAAKKARGEKLTDLEQQFAETNSSLLKRVEKDLSELDKLVADPSVQEQEGVTVIGKLTDRGRAVGKQARKAAKALRAAFPEVTIVLHTDDASFVEAAKGLGLQGTGRAFYGFESKAIHVHTGRAKNTTVAHEAFHAALRNSVDKSEVQALMGDFVTTLKKVIPADSELGTKLDKFARDYKADRVDEEYVAEFFGELAAAYPTLDRKGKTAIARFLERLSNLIGIDLTLTPDLTKRDEQILSLLETLAGKVSRGKAIKGKQVSEFQELARSTSRKQTEDKLGAAEQKVDDFSDEQIQAMADEGVIFHFSDVDITKVLPEKLKRFAFGYGFYFTNYALEDSTYRSFGDRITMVNVEDFNLLDGDKALTREQAKLLSDAAKLELQEAEEYGDMLGFEEEQVLMSLSTVQAFDLWGRLLAKNTNGVAGKGRSFTSDMTDEQMATVTRLVQEMLGFDGIVYGRPSRVGKTGAITVVWNFPKIDRAIIEPGQEPTRAAEQRVDIKTDGTGIDIEGNEPVKAGQISPTVRIDATKKRDAFLQDDFRLDDIDGTITSRASAAVGTARRLASGKVVYTKDGVKYIIELPYENKRLLSLLNRRSNAVAAVKGDTDKAKAKRAKLLERVKETTNEILAEAVEVMTQNILAVYDTLTPEFVATSKEWYVGANRVANRMAEIYGVTVEEAAGVLAALSPQNDWFNNIAVAERTFEVLENHSDTPFSREVFDKALALNMDRKGPSKWGNQLAAEFAQYEGMTLNEMEAQGVPVTVQTNLLRAIDQAMYPGKVLMTTPDGDFIGFDSTPIRWSSPVEIAKAMDMYRNPSIENIREQLGGGNKVRNFYNNIVDPNSTSPYVTADTHAASVALGIPMSANDAGGFGVFKGGRGIEYALIKEAYINAAEIAGILPREMQSITWEAQRTGINNKNRTASEIKANVELLKRLLNDETLTPYERTRRIIAENPSDNPGWATSRGIEAQVSDLLEGVEAQAESRGREVLSLRRGAGRDVGDAAARVGEPAAEGRAAEQRGARAAEQQVSPETEGPTIVYRSGAVDSKAESRYRMSGGRSTGHFGTGAYFFSDRERAEEYDKRDITAVDTRDYNLAPATYSLHDALAFANLKGARAMFNDQPHTIGVDEVRLVEAANKIERRRGGIPLSRDENYRSIPIPELYDVVFDKYYRMMLPKEEATRIAAEATRLYNEEGNIDSVSTSIMKALGYEGVYATPGSNMDNSTYGTVIYEVKPGAAEQRGVTVEQVPDPNQDFAPGTRKMIRIGGGRMEIAGNKDLDRYGILELFVPEDQRRQGIGTQLVAAAIEEADGKLAGMASKDAAVTINYNLGMRYYKPDGTEATLEETKRQRAENSYESIFMTTPEARNARRRSVYRAGDLVNKVEPRSEALSGRSTGHFGTGFYFFGDKSAAESTAEQTNRPVTELDITDYRLAPASYFLHAALQQINKRAMEANREGRPHTITPQEIQYAQVAVEQGPSFKDFYYMNDALRIYGGQLLDAGTAQRIAAEATRLYNEPGNVDSPSTSVMKALGYEGVNAVGTELDNYTYGTVIYDVRPGAAEQRVVGPEIAKVLQRYEFTPNNSLKNAGLAPELNQNLKRFGFGVKQYGTRMNDFRVIALDTGRAVDPNKIIEEGLEEGRAIAEQQRAFEAEQRARELEQRIIEIYNADERPYTGKDFEDRGAEQRGKIEAMSQPDDTMRDIVAKGREMGFRDSAIRAVLMKRYGRDSTEAINTALAENADIFTVIPKPFGNVVGGLDVGRQIYAEVRARLNEFMTPKSPARMTKKQRADRIAELREAHPDQSKLSDAQLLRRFPRPKTTPTRAEMMAEALEILRANRRFKEQPETVQKELLVGFATSLKSRANKGVQNLLSQIRRDLKERKKGAKTAREVQAQLRALINEALPKAEYSKAQVSKLTKLVNEVNEDNYIVKAQKVLDLVEQKREQIRKATIKEIIGFVKRNAKTYKTPGGRIRTRGLDAPGRAFFLEAKRVLAAVFKKDQADIMNIGFNLANNPEVDIATAKLMNGESLTVKEQMLIDQKDAYDLFAPLSDMSLEQVEAVLEDLKVTAGFSRLNLKTIRMERAARLNALRQGAKDSVEGNWGGVVTKEVEKDGETKIVAKDSNDLATDRANKKSLKDILGAQGLQGKYRTLVEWAAEGQRMTPLMFGLGEWWAHLGTLTSVFGEFFNENIYNKINRMKEENLRGEYAQKEKLNDIANSIDGITNGYKEITELIFTGGKTRVLTADEQGLTLSVKAGRRKFTTDELMRIYALSKNPIQRAKLERQGFTDKVMADIEEFLDPRLTEFVDKTVEYLSGEYYEGINDVYVKVNDVNLGYMENYFPTRTQFQADLATQSKDQLLSSTYSGPNSQMASALKERVDTGSDILMNEGLGFHGELGNHLNTMERFKAYSVGVQEINAILSDSFTVSLSELLGLGRALNDGVSAAIMPDIFKAKLDFKYIDTLMSRMVGAALAFKPMQIVKQMTSAIAGFKEYQYGKEKNLPVDILMFSMDFTRLLPKLILEGVSLGKYKGPVSTMIEDSATLRKRIEDNFGGDLYGLTSGVSGRTRRVTAKDYTLAAKALKGLARAGGTATSAGDVAGVMGYLPAYMRDIQNGMSKEEAIEKFNQYNKTQQSRREAERAPIQTYQDGLSRLFTAFTSSQLLYLNEIVTTSNNMLKSIRKGEKIKASDSRGYALALVGYSVMFTLATNMWKLMFGDDEEKEKAWLDVGLSPAKNYFVIPVLGSYLNDGYNWIVGNNYPSQVAKDPLQSTIREVTKAYKKEDYVRIGTEITEIGLGTNFDLFRGMMDIAKGQPMDESFYDVMGVPKSQRPE